MRADLAARAASDSTSAGGRESLASCDVDGEEESLEERETLLSSTSAGVFSLTSPIVLGRKRKIS